MHTCRSSCRRSNTMGTNFDFSDAQPKNMDTAHHGLKFYADRVNELTPHVNSLVKELARVTGMSPRSPRVHPNCRRCRSRSRIYENTTGLVQTNGDIR